MYRLRQAFFLVVMILVSSLAFSQKPRADILWDHYGIPHIYASSTADMYYAFGWAQMHNHADLLLKLYAQARGRSAEYFGNERDLINSDRTIWQFGIPDRAKKIYAAQSPEYKSYFDAFVDGMNAYAKAHPGSISEKFRKVLPVSVFDVAGHMIKIPCLNFLGGRDIAMSAQLVEAGSNAAAIAPSKSESKNALLMVNPHLPWGDFTTWMEADLNAPGFHAYGVSLVGMPTLGIAFNENLGWTHTNNTIDASDIYELSLKDGGYLLDSTVQQFEMETRTIKVRQGDGSLKDMLLEFSYSKHGPVTGAKNGKAYSVRLAGLDNKFLFEQYHQMMKAKNLREFESALKALQQPFFNVVYADKHGNIMYLFNGNVPKRPEGNWNFWSGVVNGSSSKYIWNAYHPYEDLPKLVNPPTGFVQNANDPPWSSTFPVLLDPKKYPAYMSPTLIDLRPQRGIKMLKDDPSISFDELVGYKMNTGVESADRFLDDLVKASEESRDSMAMAAAHVLKNWDRQTEAGSKGAVLFINWLRRITPAMFNKAFTTADPLGGPSGIKDTKKAVELLILAARDVVSKYGALDVEWGTVNRFRMGDLDLPGNGGESFAGIYRVIRFVPDKDNKSRANSGDSYVSVIEFGKKVKAQSLLSYGNASQKDNKHLGDQLVLLSQKKLRPVLFYKKDVLKHVELRESLK